jgi:hypothetical protein
MILDVVRQLENSGTDSILDLGLSKLDHRENSENLLLKMDINKIHFLDISKETDETSDAKKQEKRATFEFKYPKKTLISWKLGLKNHPKEMIGGITVLE